MSIQSSRRQFLRLGLGAAALLVMKPADAQADEGPPYKVNLPLLSSPALSNEEGRIIAPESGQIDQALAWFSARAIGYSYGEITTIVQVYQSLGREVGIDWFLALAQCAHETGSLTSWWSQVPRRNPAGIGVTGKILPWPVDMSPGPGWAWDGTQWREGLSFADWGSESIPAHLGRLLAYALPVGSGTAAQEALIGYALSLRPLPDQYRGIAPTVIDLNGRWAYPGSSYGQSILNLAQRMRAM